MTAHIKVKDSPNVKLAALSSGGCLDVWTKEGYRRYQARAAIKKLEKQSASPNEVTFKIEMVDGLTFTGVSHLSVFSHLERDYRQGPQPGDFVIVPGAKPPSKRAEWAVLLLIGAVIVWCFTGGETKTPSPAPSQNQVLSESTAQVMAKTICEMRVKDTLKAPSTADFPFFSQATFDGSRRATLSSYVDAQNGFGAMIRTSFVCTVEYGGGDTGARESWKIVDFVVLQ